MNPPYEFSVEEIRNAVNNLKKFECDDFPYKKMCVLDFDLLNHIVGDLEAKNKRLEKVLAEQKAYIEKLENKIKELKVEIDVYED